MRRMKYRTFTDLELETLQWYLDEWGKTGWIKSGQGLQPNQLWWLCLEKEIRP